MKNKAKNVQQDHLPHILLAVAAFLLLNSCKKFLDVEPPNSKVPIEQVFTSEAIVNSAFAGIYLNLYSNAFADGSATSLASLAGLSADELHYNALQPDPTIIPFEGNSLLSDNTCVLGLWISMYKVIYQANDILEGLPTSKNITAAKKDEFRGEALFIRAFCHFYLINAFGDVPLVTTTNHIINSKLPRTTVAKVYDQIEADLLEAESLLPDKYADGQRIRPIKTVATALLARLYLYKEDWQKAEENASNVINKSTIYQLEDSLNNVFLAGSREAIWQLKPADGSSATNEGSIFLVSKTYMLTDTLIHSFQYIDRRIIKWTTLSGTTSVPFKYKQYIASSQPSTEYSMVFRLAEQHLIRAEARARLGMFTGNDDVASDINIIRRRAGLTDTTISNITDAMSIIENERRHELFTEWGHRWFDLKRWHRATEILSPLKTGFTVEDMLYPIPQEEMNRDPYLTPQNPGYE